MVSRPPRLRKDLTCRHEQTAEGTCVIIKHPASRRFFRLEHAEYFIARQLDGKTPLETIRKRTETAFEAELPIETLHAFIQTLNKNGLLETEEALQKDARRKPKRFRGSPLYCRIQLCDPCELLKWLARRAAFLFTRQFVVLSALSILLAAAITAANWSEFRDALPEALHFAAAPAILLVIFCVIVAHEFGHGVTCTHFGGEVHEMGFAAVFLMPAFYCNVSDAWLFPERSRRLWVGFAGPYFELFLWSLAVFTWRLTEPTTLINFVALTVMATSGIHTMLNFNPLIKLDGYYLLSDYLELPNLRKRSFRQVGSVMEHLFGFGAEEKDEELTSRERRIFWLYGTIALAGSFSILGYIIVGAGSTLIAGRTPTAVLITLFLLFMKFRRRFRRMFASPHGAAGSLDDMDFDDPDDNANEEESFEPAHTEYFEPATTKEGELHQPMAAQNGNGSSAGFATGDARKPAATEAQEGHSEDWRSDSSVDSILDAMYGRRIRSMQTKPATADHARATFTYPPSTEPDDQPPSQPAEAPSAVPEPVPGKIEPHEREQHSKTQTRKHSEPEEKKSRRLGRYVRRAVWMAFAAAAGVALFYVHWEAQASGPLNILPVRNADVRTEIDGLVDQLLVSEGSIVHKGDLIARLSIRENKAALDQAEGQIQQLKAQLRLQLAGPTPEEIEVAKTAVAKAKDSLSFARVKLDATRELFKNNLVARLELDTAQDLYATSQDDLADAEGKLKVLLNGTRPEQIDQTRAQISGLQAQERFLQGQIERAEVRSPVDGIVATPELELKELAGQVVLKGALIAKVFELRKTTVEIAVPENEIPDVKVGQKVVLKVRAYPSETFNGAVTSIATSAFAPASSGESTLLPTPTAPTSSSTPKTILVTTEIDNRSMLLKPGMTGHAKILCGQRRLIDLISRKLARTIKVQFWSWW